MLRIPTRALAGLAFLVLLAAPTLSGCDAFESVFGGDQEITGIVEEVGSDFLTVDAVRYTVNADTKFEGYTGLSDIRVGDEVKVEYKDQNGERVASNIEDPATADQGGSGN